MTVAADDAAMAMGRRCESTLSCAGDQLGDTGGPAASIGVSKRTAHIVAGVAALFRDRIYKDLCTRTSPIP